MRARGWAAFTAVQEAERCLAYGGRAEAAKLLLAAACVSPPHAFFRPNGFWRMAVTLFH